MAGFLSPIGNGFQFFTTQGVVLALGTITTYLAGTTTLQATYTDSTLSVSNGTTITLGSDGRPQNEIWIPTGVSIKMVLKDSSGVTIATYDNLSGINDIAASSGSDWNVTGLIPTYISTTQFSVPGDYALTFVVDRRIKLTVTAGTIYGVITASSYATGVTTVTVAIDAGTLDTGLSAVSVGLLSPTNPSIPQLFSMPYLNISGNLFLKDQYPSNFTITTSVGSNALTIALKGYDGNDPSTRNPIYVPFRSATATTGDVTWLTVTAATNLVVSSGSTLGTTSATIARLWLVGFNDASTFRLGIVNCLSGTNIMSLKSDLFYSSTAEGGAGAADSAQVIYTGVAVSSKSLVVLGYIEVTEAIAGTWATAPSKVQRYYPGMRLPGDLVQVQENTTGAVATGTTVVPWDDTIPQNTEGDQFLSQAITPTSSVNIIVIESLLCFASSAAQNSATCSIFQDSTANALKTASTSIGSPNFQCLLSIKHKLLAGTTSATTFKVRIGGDQAGTTTFNGSGSARKYGGVFGSYLSVMEVIT